MAMMPARLIDGSRNLTDALSERAPGKWMWIRRHWPAICLIGLLLGALSWASTEWLGRLPVASGVVGDIAALGTVLAVVGLLISLCGFGLTLRQLALTQTAVEATMGEAERIRRSLRTYDAAQDATKAQYALVAAKTHFDSNAYSQASDHYAECRLALLSVRENVEGLPDDLVKSIEVASNYIESLCIRIDKGLSSLDAKQLSEMRNHKRLISTIQTYLQRRSF